MKRFALFLTPLMVISLLTNCNSGSKLYTVIFNLNGGTSEAIPTQTVKEKEKASKPSNPTKVKEGYTCSFLHWELDNKEFDFNTQITNNITLDAKWQEEINQNTVSVISEDISKGTVTGGGIYDYGSSVTVKATPNTGYSFECWYNDETPISSEPTYSFKMPINGVSYKAKFKINQYTVSVTSEDISKGAVTGSGSYMYNSSVTITATPFTGYSFECWYEDNKKVSLPNPCTFTMPASNVSYEARFKANQYTASVTSEDESKGKVTGSGSYAYGSNVTIEATPKTGYSFEGWYEDNKKLSLPNPYTFNMPANDVNYEARFIANRYAVSVTSEDESKGTVTGSGSYAYGSNVTIEATPKTGYSFEGWYEDNKKLSLPNPYTFNMPANDVNYEARFTINKYTVTLIASPGEGGEVTGDGAYESGSSVTITATPSAGGAGYQFEGWYEDGKKICSSSPYTFTMPASNVSYEAKFYATNGPWYQRRDWWNYCSNGEFNVQAKEEDIGTEVDLIVNNIIHKVRLIDIDHDFIYSSSTQEKAHCTFEFVNLLSDSDGYSLATLWNTKDGVSSKNYNYLNSDLRRALDKMGDGALRWYQKGSKIKSNTYTKSVRDMLPDELKDKIKTVNKTVGTFPTEGSEYTTSDYTAKVFTLSHDEIRGGSSYTKKEGTPYKYYIDHFNDSSRIKQQVKGHVGAIGDSTKITDSDITWSANNYAGHNDSRTEFYGSYYWLTSPHTVKNYNDAALHVSSDGGLDYTDVYSCAYPVAPAFCI